MPTQPHIPTVFLIDDDEFLLDLYAEKAKHAEVHLVTFTNAEDAFAALESGARPDALVVDIILPAGMNGLDFIRTLRARRLATGAPVIVLTNKSEPPYPQDARDLDIAHYIVKATFLPSEVMEVIHKTLAEHKVPGTDPTA